MRCFLTCARNSKADMSQLNLQHGNTRDVEGSCAKHLIIEFYTVVMLLTFLLIIIIVSIPSPLTLLFQA